MSIIYRFSRQAVPLQTRNIFAATFNVVPGKYSFPIAPANANQVVLELDPRFTYQIDRVSFTASIDDGVYLRSIDVVPEFLFTYRKNNTVAYPNKLPAINYPDGLEFCFAFGSEQVGDALLVSMRGVLNQVPETVGVLNIYAHLSLVIYTEHSETAVQAMKEERGHAVSRFYSGK